VAVRSVLGEEVLGARQDGLGAFRFGARLADGVGQQRHVHRRAISVAGVEGEVAQVDLGEVEDGGHALEDVDRDVGPFLESGEVTAAHAGQFGQLGLGEAFADACFANCVTEHKKELLGYSSFGKFATHVTAGIVQ
jgi:hypothetical protein